MHGLKYSVEFLRFTKEKLFNVYQVRSALWSVFCIYIGHFVIKHPLNLTHIEFYTVSLHSFIASSVEVMERTKNSSVGIEEWKIISSVL